MRKVVTHALLIIAMSLFAIPASADDFSERPIRLVVAGLAGGGIDLVARLIAPGMSAALDANVIVDNRPGANMAIGASFVAHSPPDGHTIFISTSGPITNAFDTPLPYDAETAFQPISRVMTSPFFLVVPEQSKIQNLADLIALAKTPNQVLRYGHPGIGTATQLASALFAKLVGGNFIDVPYRGAAGQVNDTLSGELQFGLLAAPDALSRRGQGLRVIGVSTSRRSELAPDIPAIAEAGLPGYDVELWHGLFVAGATPRVLVDKINSALRAALKNPDIGVRFRQLGMIPAFDTPEQFSAIVRAQRESDVAIVKSLNLKAPD